MRWSVRGLSRVATAFAILLVLHRLDTPPRCCQGIRLGGSVEADAIHLSGSGRAVARVGAALHHDRDALFVWPRGWWLIGGAIGISMLAIIPSWADAKAGAVVNGIVSLGLVLGCLSQGPSSLRAEYEADVRAMRRTRCRRAS